jgi:hypothetical protein
MRLDYGPGKAILRNYSELDDKMLIDILAVKTADYARMLKEGGDFQEMSTLKECIITLQKEIIARKEKASRQNGYPMDFLRPTPDKDSII